MFTLIRFYCTTTNSAKPSWISAWKNEKKYKGKVFQSRRDAEDFLLCNIELKWELEDLLLETFLSWRKLSNQQLYDLCIASGLNPPKSSISFNLIQALITDFQANHCMIASHSWVILHQQVMRCSFEELQNLCVANSIAYGKRDDSALLQDKVVAFMKKDGLVLSNLKGYNLLEAYKR